jgi:effector-binding domain-containing protein
VATRFGSCKATIQRIRSPGGPSVRRPIDTARRPWHSGGMDYHVDVIELDEQPTAVVRDTVVEEHVAAFLGGAFGEVISALEVQGLPPAGPPFARYVVLDGGFQVEAGFPCAGPAVPAGRVVPATLPGGRVAIVLHRGPYSEVAAAYRAAEAWLVQNSWEATGAPWEAYLDGPEVAEPRTIVHVPCRPA